MKRIQIAFIIALSFVGINPTFSANLDKIEVLDKNNIEVTATSDVIFTNSVVDGEIKVLKDLNVSFVKKDTENKKKLLLNISSEFKTNTSYSLIALLGVEGNIDFNIGDIIESEFVNTFNNVSVQGIDKIIIKSSTLMELYFNEEILEDEFEFKLLNEITVNEISSMGDNKITLKLNSDLISNLNYIMMVLSLEDKNGDIIILDEDLYDFRTSSFEGEEVVEETGVEENIKKEETNEEEANEENQIEKEGLILESAKEKNDVESVAVNAPETPDTGAETWVLVFLTLFLHSAYIIRKKVLKK